MNKRAIVYIGGYNLYYGLLKGTSYKWLDLNKFARLLVRDDFEIVAVRYFTAPEKVEFRYCAENQHYGIICGDRGESPSHRHAEKVLRLRRGYPRR